MVTYIAIFSNLNILLHFKYIGIKAQNFILKPQTKKITIYEWELCSVSMPLLYIRKGEMI